LPPQTVQRKDRLRRSLEASAPHLIMNGAIASGTPRAQTGVWQYAQTQGVPFRRCASVNGGFGGSR
jgi:hypothetical protein